MSVASVNGRRGLLSLGVLAVALTGLVPVLAGAGLAWGTLACWLGAHGALALWLQAAGRSVARPAVAARGGADAAAADGVSGRMLGGILASGLLLRLVYALTVTGQTMVRLDDPFVGGIGWMMLQAATDPLVLTGAGNDPAALAVAGNPRPWVWLLAAMDGVLLWRLPGLLQRWGRPRYWLAVYAWSPLVLWCGIGGLRPEMPALFFVVSGLLLAEEARSRRTAFLFIAVAACFAWPAGLAALFMARRRDLLWLLGVVLLPVGLYLVTGISPYTAHWLEPRIAPMALANVYAGDPILDVFPRLLAPVLGWNGLRLACLLAWLAGVLGVWLLKQGSLRVSFMLGWLGLYACTPELRVWELAPLPFLLLLAPSRTVLLLAALCGVAALHPALGLDPRLTWWLSVPPVLLLALVEGSAIRRIDGSPGSPLRRIDVVIPTLDEEARLSTCLDHLHGAVAHLRQARGDAAPVVQVIIADAGSTDRTRDIAGARADRLVDCPRRGRGNQYAAGIAAGAGDLVLMLHADAVMETDALVRLLGAFDRQPGLEWGVLGHVYDQRSLRLRLVEVSNRIRFHLGGIAFGDQGIFVRRDILRPPCTMPEIPLMEDIELSLRLADHPCRASLNRGLILSTRQWERYGHARYMRLVLSLTFSYLSRRRLGADVPALAAAMYRRYYGRDPGDAAHPAPASDCIPRQSPPRLK